MSKSGHLKLIDFGTAEFSKSDLVLQGFKDKIEEQKKAREKKYQDVEETNN